MSSLVVRKTVHMPLRGPICWIQQTEFKATITNVRRTKQTMSKELKEGITMSHQIDNTN